MEDQRYVLIKCIAQGGMAEIYIGKTTGSDDFTKIYAFKKILKNYAQDNDFINMFRHEALLVKQLQHKNIVQVYDFVGHDETYMLVMEFVNGLDLRHILGIAEQKRMHLPIEVITYILIELLSGLEHAHTAKDPKGQPIKIVHRDVSPQNILISFDGEIKITDFGVAKAKSQTSTTQAGVLKGKFRYMSPEQAGGEPLDNRTDIFASGIILYEMLTMTQLFKGDSLAILESIRRCEIVPPSRISKHKIPPTLEAIVMKLLSKNPQNRYQSAKEAAKDLSKFLNGFKQDFYPSDLHDFLKALVPEKQSESKKLIEKVLSYQNTHTKMLEQIDAISRSGKGDAKSLFQSIEDSHVSSQTTPKKNIKENPSLDRNKVAPKNTTPSPAQKQVKPVQNSPTNLSVIRSQDLKLDQKRKLQQRSYNPSLQNIKPYPNYSQRPRTSSSSLFDNYGFLIIVLILIGVFAFLNFSGFNRPSQLLLRITPGGVAQIEMEGTSSLKQSFEDSTLLKLPMGDYTFKIKKLGFKVKNYNFSVGRFGSKQDELLVLEQETNTTILGITSQPTGAQVLLEGGKAKGVTPTQLPYIPVGRNYRISLTHPKCTKMEKVIKVPAKISGANVNFHFNFKNCL